MDYNLYAFLTLSWPLLGRRTTSTVRAGSYSSVVRHWGEVVWKKGGCAQCSTVGACSKPGLAKAQLQADSAVPSPPLEFCLWQVRACAGNSTVQCWYVPKGAIECSENWGKTCVKPKQDHEKKNPGALNDCINYSGKQHPIKQCYKHWLASSKEWPGAAIPGGLEGWNCCRRSVAVCEHQVDSSIPGRWLVSGLPEMWKGYACGKVLQPVFVHPSSPNPLPRLFS